MRAIISGRAGIAVLIDDMSVSYIDVEEPQRRVPCQAHDIPFLLGDEPLTETIQDVDLESAVLMLERATSCSEALQLTMHLLNPNLDSTIRREAADAVDALLYVPMIKEHVQNILTAVPFPKDADPQGAITICTTDSTVTICELLRQVEGSQPSIETVWRAWEDLPVALFQSANDRLSLRSSLVQSGIFRKAARLLSLPNCANRVLNDALQLERVREFPNHREILTHWTTLFEAASQRLSDNHLLWIDIPRLNKQFTPLIASIIHRPSATPETWSATQWAINQPDVKELVEPVVGYMVAPYGAITELREVLHVETTSQELFMQFRPLVASLLRRYGSTPELRKGLQGEIYRQFQLLVDNYDLDRGIPIAAYLTRMLSQRIFNYARDYWRGESRYIHVEPEVPEGAGVAGQGDPEGALQVQEVLSTLPSVIASLPHRQRLVLVWRYYEERSFEDIAFDLGIRPATARSLLRHAVISLRARMARDGFSE
jgi:RNA polymerase sigma factor (sigma-70 family)